MDTPIELIAKGTFGAIVKVFDGDHHAVKIQMVGSSKKSDREYEILRDLQQLVETKMSPCVLGVRGCVRTDDLGKTLARVSQMKQTLNDIKTKSLTYQLVKMDIVHGPNLREYMRAHATLGTPLDMKELKGISFQLFWTTAMANRIMDFKHRDLKPANIMLSSTTSHIYGLSGSTWKTTSKVPIPIDFNLSTSSNNPSDKDWRCGTVSYMPPEKIYKIKRNAADEGFSHDPWSLGIILFSMALCGRRLGDTTAGFNGDELFNPGKTETVYQLWIPHSEHFKENLCHQLPDHDWTTIKHAMCLSLLQEALGNGAFPRDWPEFDRTPLCITLKNNWKSIKSALYSSSDSILVSKCPDVISSQIGYDATDLIKGLLSWNPNERITADLALTHRFFDSLRVNDEIPMWHPPTELICANCGRHAPHRCSRCLQVHYCSSRCLEDDWINHKYSCKK